VSGATAAPRARLVALLEPLAIGDDLLPGVRLVDASTELGLRLTFAVDRGELHVEVTPITGARP